MIKKVFFLILLSIVFNTYSQKKDRILLNIDGKPVYTSEFINIYNKNKDIIIDDDHKDVDQYLDLFIDFKLKLLDAYELKLDTTASFIAELNKYHRQLAEPYLQNEEEMSKLVKEAYERTKTQVDVSHILVLLSPDAAPVDTLKAYKKIDEAYQKVLSGIPFGEVAKAYSEDRSVKFNQGRLGYFSAFQMTYPFENAAYDTPVGKISKPFRTEFGYHILKVENKRKSPGQIEAALIFIKNKPGDSVYARSLIYDIYGKLRQGEAFENLAQKYSDDRSSAAKGGILPKFGTGKLIQPIDSIAFSIKNEGDYTKPFQSDYGWHILKLIKKYPVGSFEDLKNELTFRVRNSNRSVIIKRTLARDLESKLKITENKPVIDLINRNKYNNTDSKTVILSIEDMNYSLKDFNFFKRPFKNKSSREIYTDFKADKIVDYYKSHLEDYNLEFAKTLKEYKDGLLLFDLLQNHIWKKAEKDSAGLRKFFEKNIDQYQWKKRARILTANCTRMDKAENVRQLLIENKTPDEIKEAVNEGATIHVIFKELILEEDSNKLPADYKIVEGISKIYQEDNRHYTIFDVLEIYPAGPKKFEETKGQVLNDYQNYLEQEWVKTLRKEHHVTINKKALKKLKKTLAKK